MNKLSRKKFLFNTSIFLTIPMLLETCTTIYPRLKGDELDPIKNAKVKGFEEPILQAINVGITAPNPHNTQAWKFRILNSLEMDLHIDEKRILKITDPPTRQIHIGQGTFLELFKIGASELGFDTQIKILPDGENKLDSIEKKPIARIKLVPKANNKNPLYEFIKQRATNRGVYFGENITSTEFEKIKVLGNSSHSKLFFVQDEKMKSYLDIFFKSMSIESSTVRLNDESRIWFRFGENEVQTKRDGISLRDQGTTGLTLFLAEKFFLDSTPQKFHNPTGIKIFLDKYKEKIDSTKGIVYWKTETNTQKDWILTGMDYARFQLSATAQGLKLHPFSQALQEFPEMDEERKKLEELTNVKKNEKVQMIVRIGRSNFEYYTPRRDFKEMIL